MSIEAMKQWAEDVSKAYDLTAWGHTQRAAEILKQTRDSIRTVIAQPAPVQVSPTDFVDMVMDKEDAIGKPILWAEWPNREKNNAA
jgi:hypothetical protein